MKVNIITLGCSKNTVDSENIAGHLQQAGATVVFDRRQNDCDIVVVNTCGFLGDAKEDSVNMLLQQVDDKVHFNQRHARDHRQRLLVAVGCLVERYRDELRCELPEVDAWYGVHQWNELVGYLVGNLHMAEVEMNHPVGFAHLRMVSTPAHYAYLKIAEGCNRHCSYCAIPLIRGHHVSRPIDELVAEAKKLVQQGAKEIILIAQDTTYYGLDLYGERKLGTLMERIAAESGAHWIRLHYTYPTSFPIDAIEVMRSHDNICNYIDIPLQHINSRILGSMNRGIDREGTLQLLQHLRNRLPNVCIRTTLIVGYPGETEEEFEELKAFVSEARFDRMGCFAYSAEDGTDAALLEDSLTEEEKEDRVSQLMQIQESISMERNEARVGNEYEVLVDRREGNYYVARTEFDSPEVDDEVLIATDKKLVLGEFYWVRIAQAMEHDLLGELV